MLVGTDLLLVRTTEMGGLAGDLLLAVGGSGELIRWGCEPPTSSLLLPLPGSSCSRRIRRLLRDFLERPVKDEAIREAIVPSFFRLGASSSEADQ